jgi:RNA-directed DNA polymerase
LSHEPFLLVITRLSVSAGSNDSNTLADWFRAVRPPLLVRCDNARTTEARDKRRGIPQGSQISPLLANIYMRRFVLGWKMFGLERTLGTRLVTYADDLVILCRRGKGEEALQRLREIMGKLRLTVNEEKTRVCKVPEGEFDFLGYTFGRMYSARTGQARIGYRPSKKSIQRAVEKIH